MTRVMDSTACGRSLPKCRLCTVGQSSLERTNVVGISWPNSPCNSKMYELRPGRKSSVALGLSVIHHEGGREARVCECVSKGMSWRGRSER